MFGCSLRQSYPIVKDTFNKYPKQLKVEGVIVKIGSHNAQCGVLCCYYGTIQVHLNKRIHGYHHKDVFIAIPCYNIRVNQLPLHKKIKIDVQILTLNNAEGWYDHTCFIDSKGIPFYYIHESDVTKFLVD